MRLTKSGALLIALFMLFAVFVLLYVRAGTIAEIPVGSLVAGIVTLTAGYIGMQVANNGVRGKTFNPDLWDREHSKGE